LGNETPRAASLEAARGRRFSLCPAPYLLLDPLHAHCGRVVRQAELRGLSPAQGQSRALIWAGEYRAWPSVPWVMDYKYATYKDAYERGMDLKWRFEFVQIRNLRTGQRLYVPPDGFLRRN
jgi:hypothetical protein